MRAPTSIPPAAASANASFANLQALLPRILPSLLGQVLRAGPPANPSPPNRSVHCLPVLSFCSTSGSNIKNRNCFSIGNGGTLTQGTGYQVMVESRSLAPDSGANQR